MKLNALHTLEVVIREGSYAAAAPVVNLTASAIGLQMRQLEAYFGRPLFDRSARHVRPTEFARQVAAAVTETLNKVDSLRLQEHIAVEGHVRMGIIESAMISVLPKAIQRLRAFAPGVEILVTRGVSQDLLQEVKAGKLDLAVIVRPERGRSTRLHWHALYSEGFTLVAPPNSRGTSPADLLRQYEWVRFDRGATGGRIAAAYVERIAPGKRPIVELPGTDAIIACVADGLGVSVIPTPRPELARAYAFRQIPVEHARREIVLVCRRADNENRRILAVQRAFAEVPHRLQ